MLSKQEKIQEILKCGNDPAYFINSYVYIQHPKQGRLPFKTYDFQDSVINSLQNHRFNIVLKSRQLGLSTVAAAYAVWYAIFHRDKNILIIATKLETAMNFIKKVKIALQSLPDWLLLPKYENNKRQFVFDNGSQILAIPTSEDAGRSEALSLLIVDEAAFIRNFEDIWAGLYPTLSTGGQALIISTPNGIGGLYYKLWTDAEAGQNSFNTIKLPWYVHPEHDQAWFVNESKNLSKRKIAQELMCDFLASGDTFLQPDVIEYLNEQIVPPKEKAGFDRNVWVWGDAKPGHKYVLTADVARGDAADYSTFHVVDYEKSEVVVEYMGKLPPEKFAGLIDEWGRKYNNALVCPENNSFGYATCVTLRDVLKYPRLYYSKAKGNPFEYIPLDRSELPGMSTQKNTRVQMLTKLEELVRNRNLHMYSQRCFDQFKAFVWMGAKPSALRDSHDDLIMSLAIAAWLVGGAGKLDEEGVALAYALLQATSRTQNGDSRLLAGVDTVKPPMRNQYASQIGFTNDTVYKPVAAEEHERARSAPNPMDFSWLLK